MLDKTEILIEKRVDIMFEKNKVGSLKKNTLRGFAWLISGAGIQSVLQFIVLIVFARLLEPKAFGVIGAALVVISFLKILSTIGLGPALVQKKDIKEEHVYTSFTFALFLGLCLSSIVFITSPYIAVFFHMEELSVVLKLMSVVFILDGLSRISESLIQRRLMFNILVRIQVISYLSYGIIGTILAFMGLGVWALIAAFLSQMLIKTLLSFYLQPYKVKFKFDISSFKELFYFSGGYSLSQISTQFSKEGDNFIVGRFLGADALGLYSRAYQLMVTPVNLLGKVLDKVLFPALSKVQNNQKKVAYVFEESVRITTTLMFPGTIFIAFNSKNIVMLLFGEQWLDLTAPFQILALTLFFRSSYKISSTIAKAKGVVYYRAFVNWIYAGMVLLFAYIGQFYGLKGVAIGVSAAIFLNYVFMTLLGINLTRIKLGRLLKAHLGGTILAFMVCLTLLFCAQFTNVFIKNYLLELLFSVFLFIGINIICILVSPALFIGTEGKRVIKSIKSKIKT